VRDEGGDAVGEFFFWLGLGRAEMWGRKLLGRDAGTVGREYVM